MLSPQSLSVGPSRRDRITAFPTAVQRRPIVLVLGMHRSGTSLCSHILSALGVDMTDKVAGPGNPAPTPDNPQGHWERWEIVEFHDRILRLFNREYFGHFHDFALPVAWWADPRVAKIRREIVAFLEQRMGDGYFGFKDPRTVRLMPMWHQIFNELKLAPRIVLCLRNPAQVARSLHARDGLDSANGEYRWLVHVIDFFRYASNFDRCVVEYEEWFENPSVNIEKLQKFLGLPWLQSEADLSLVLSGIIDPGARHDDSDHREAGQPLVRTLYKLAQRAGEEDGARAQITSIASQFVGFQQLQRPFQQAFEDIAKLVAKFPEIERELATLRAAAGDSHALVEEQRTQLEELARERAARVLIENEASSLKAALAGLSCRADELAAALESAQAERLALQEILQRAEQEAQQRAEQEAQQRAGATDALQGEIAALREAQKKWREQTDAVEALEAEIRALRGSLMRAEEAAADRAAAVTAMQDEITALQNALAAARQVGRAAIDAFRLNAVVPTEPASSPRWRQAIMRVFGSRASY